MQDFLAIVKIQSYIIANISLIYSNSVQNVKWFKITLIRRTSFEVEHRFRNCIFQIPWDSAFMPPTRSWPTQPFKSQSAAVGVLTDTLFVAMSSIATLGGLVAAQILRARGLAIFVFPNWVVGDLYHLPWRTRAKTTHISWVLVCSAHFSRGLVALRLRTVGIDSFALTDPAIGWQAFFHVVAERLHEVPVCVGFLSKGRLTKLASSFCGDSSRDRRLFVFFSMLTLLSTNLQHACVVVLRLGPSSSFSFFIAPSVSSHSSESFTPTSKFSCTPGCCGR